MNFTHKPGSDAGVDHGVVAAVVVWIVMTVVLLMILVLRSRADDRVFAQAAVLPVEITV